MPQETSSRKASVTPAYPCNDFVLQFTAMSATETADYLAQLQSRQKSRSLRAFRCEAATLDRPVVGQRRLPRNDTVETGQRRLLTVNLLCLHLGRVAR